MNAIFADYKWFVAQHTSKFVDTCFADGYEINMSKKTLTQVFMAGVVSN